MDHKIFRRRVIHILLLSLGIVLLAVLFYLLAAAGIGLPCLFHKFTGLLCPGCGNSRAAICLLRLDIAGAFGYNLLFPVEFLYLAWVYFFCCQSYLKGGKFAYKPPFPILDLILLILILLWGVVRNII